MDKADIIGLKVKAQDGSHMFFKIKRSTSLFRLLRAYCEKKGLEYPTVQFLFNGHRVTARQTPRSLDMVDGDEIDALVHVTGGAPVGFQVQVKEELWNQIGKP